MSALDNLEEFQEEAKGKRLNIMWQYDDEESTKPVKAGGWR